MSDINEWAKANPHNGECWSCGWETKDLTAYRRSNRGFNDVDPSDENDGRWLCGLCAGTLAGNALDYPTHYDGPTLQTICYVGNAILAAIRGDDTEGA